MDSLAAALLLLAFSSFLWTMKRFNEWWYLRHINGCSGVQIPPGNMGWPIIGETIDLLWSSRESPLGFIEKRLAKYNIGIYRSHLLGSPCIVTTNPDFSKFVLSSDSMFRTAWSSPQLLGARSFASVEGEQHLRIRRFISEAISQPMAMKKVMANSDGLIKSQLQSWAEKGTVTLRQEIRQATFRSVCYMFFRLDPGKLVDIIEKEVYQFIAAFQALFHVNLPGFAYHRGLQSQAKLKAIIQSTIDNRRKMGASVEGDVLDILMHATDPKTGDKLTDEELCDNMVGLIFGAHESTSATIMWTLIQLAKHPHVLHRVREEHKAIQESKKEYEQITIDDVKLMPYTRNVIKETLRLALASTFLLREAILDVHYKGFMFPRGWKVITFIGNCHLDSTYFEDPHKFHPERFMETNFQSSTYEPFGGGARRCPGNHFAIARICLFLHHLVLNFRWELLHPNMKITYFKAARITDEVKIQFSHI